MGLTRWLARRGGVGGTARWAAKGYNFFRQRHPDPQELSDPELFRLMVMMRYKAMPDPRAEQFLLGIVNQVNGLQGLVVAILMIEAGFTENDDSVQRMFMEIIVEELEKKGIPEIVIYGDRP